jgi:hypothetical protein
MVKRLLDVVIANTHLRRTEGLAAASLSAAWDPAAALASTMSDCDSCGWRENPFLRPVVLGALLDRVEAGRLRQGMGAGQKLPSAAALTWTNKCHAADNARMRVVQCLTKMTHSSWCIDRIWNVTCGDGPVTSFVDPFAR